MVAVHGLNFTPKNVIATLSLPPSYTSNIQAALGPGPCPAGTQFRVAAYTDAGVFSGSGFFLSVN